LTTKTVAPPIDNVRYTEDYGYLRGGDPDAMDALSPWGPVKYIPLNKAGDVYLTLGAELRLRYERYEDNNWGQGPQDNDGYLWARALPRPPTRSSRRGPSLRRPVWTRQSTSSLSS
jgi:hypothetical protein